MIEFIFFLFMLICLILLYMEHRNNKVYEFRIKMIRQDFEKYQTMPSYDKMMFSFVKIKDFDKVWDKNTTTKDKQ